MSLIKEIYENVSATKIDLIINEFEDMHNGLSMLDEGVTDLPDGLDIDHKFEIAVARLEAARRGMELLKKLGGHVASYKSKYGHILFKDKNISQQYTKARQFMLKNTSRVMSNLQSAGKLVDDLVDHIQNQYDISQDTISQGSGGQIVGRAANLASRVPPSDPEGAKDSYKAQTGNNPPKPSSWTDRIKGLFK